MDYKIPNHIAIIMDGNGRWAQKRGLKRTKGHQMGAKVLKKISEYVYDKKIKVLSVFAFSTENWKRDKEEVDYLMDLFIKVFKDNFKSIKEKGVKKIKFLCIIAAPEGLKRVQEKHPDVQIYCAKIDDHLNEDAYIVPGLGDAGDRIYGTK